MASIGGSLGVLSEFSDDLLAAGDNEGPADDSMGRRYGGRNVGKKGQKVYQTQPAGGLGVRGCLPAGPRRILRQAGIGVSKIGRMTGPGQFSPFWDELAPISQHEVVVDCESAFHRFIVAVDSMGSFGPDDYGPELSPRFPQPRMTAHDRLPLCDESMTLQGSRHF